MFDARSILDILVGGGPRRQGRPSDPTVLKEMLDQLGDQGSSPTAGPQQAPAGGRWSEQRYPQGQPEPTRQPAPPARAPTGGPAGGPTGSMSLEDLLRSIFTQVQHGQGPAGGPAAPPGGAPAGSPEVGKELQDLLRQILQGTLGGRGPAPGTPGAQASRLVGENGGAGGPTGGDLAEALKQVLGQATAGVREGAARVDEATGLSGKAREALGQATGQTADELVARLKELIAQNQLAAGAALGGLGALVLGTGTGRSLAATAVKLGGVALIGGLAYKAYQSYRQGRPPLAAGRPDQAQTQPQTLMPAPDGSGFEPGAVTHDAARHYIRAMIAAAAADGRIDTAEQQKILGGLRQAGLDDPAQQFLAAEIGSPATVAELASGIASPEEALQVYAAARIAVDVDTTEEHAFLSALAGALGIDRDLAAQVDAAARGTAA